MRNYGSGNDLGFDEIKRSASTGSVPLYCETLEGNNNDVIAEMKNSHPSRRRQVASLSLKRSPTKEEFPDAHRRICLRARPCSHQRNSQSWIITSSSLALPERRELATPEETEQRHDKGRLCLKSHSRPISTDSSPPSGEMFIATRLPSDQLRKERNARHFALCGRRQREVCGFYKHHVPTARRRSDRSTMTFEARPIVILSVRDQGKTKPYASQRKIWIQDHSCYALASALSYLQS